LDAKNFLDKTTIELLVKMKTKIIKWVKKYAPSILSSLMRLLIITLIAAISFVSLSYMSEVYSGTKPFSSDAFSLFFEELFIVIFFAFIFLALFMYIFVGFIFFLREASAEINLENKINKFFKEKIELNKRFLLVKFLNYLSIIFLLISFVTFCLSTYRNYFFLFILGALVSMFIGDSALSNYDLALYYLRKVIEKSPRLNDLTRALFGINRALGESLGKKELYSLSQKLLFSFEVGKGAEVKEGLMRLMHAVEREEKGEVYKELLELSKNCDKHIKGYEEKLGFEIKIPINVRIHDAIKYAFKISIPKNSFSDIYNNNSIFICSH